MTFSNLRIAVYLFSEFLENTFFENCSIDVILNAAAARMVDLEGSAQLAKLAQLQ